MIMSVTVGRDYVAVIEIYCVRDDCGRFRLQDSVNGVVRRRLKAGPIEPSAIDIGSRSWPGRRLRKSDAPEQ